MSDNKGITDDKPKLKRIVMPVITPTFKLVASIVKPHFISEIH